MYFIQICLAYAAAFGYSQFPEYGGKILGGHIACALVADLSGELRRQKQENELEKRIMNRVEALKKDRGS